MTITRESLTQQMEALRQQEAEGHAKAQQARGALLLAEYLLGQLDEPPATAAEVEV